jgi:PAS domain S-box-containing protein
MSDHELSATGPRTGLVSWSKQVAGAALRVAHLRQRAVTQPTENNPIIQEALQELDTAHEELRVAEEQLHAQVDAMQNVQTALVRERQRYRDLFEAAPEAYLVTDARGHVRDANRRAAALFNIDATFFIGKPLVLFVHPAHRTQLREVLNDSTLGTHIANYTWRIEPRRAHPPLWSSVSVSRAPSDEDAPYALRWMFHSHENASTDSEPAATKSLLKREAEARRAVENELHQRDDFLAATAHELRSPISSIAGWLDLLGRDQPDSPMRERAFASMHRSVRALTHMVEQLVDKARVAEGVLLLETGRLQLSSIVQSCLDEHGPAAHAKGVKLSATLDDGLPVVQGDALRLQQVVSNLIGNALKFTPASGEISVSVLRRGDCAELSVRDTGCGIAPAALRTVFEPFVQLDNQPAEGTRGLGLGLDIARRLVELHGGTIQADSPGKGQGSTFTVRLPLSL